MKAMFLGCCAAMLTLLPGCATKTLVSVVQAADAPRCEFRDYTLAAGLPSPSGCYPELVRVERSGHALLRLQQKAAIYVDATPGYMIPEAESDFCGVLLDTDFRRQSAIIRQYDLGRPL